MKNKKTKHNVNKFKTYLTITSLLLGWLSLTNLLLIIKYDILPLKYFILAIIILVVVPSIIIIFSNRKKTKPIIKKILSGISLFLSIILIIILFYLNKTFSFIDNLTQTGYKTENYSVIVLKESDYNSIENLKDKTISYYNQETTNINKVLEELNKIINYNTITKENYISLVESLYNKETDAIIIEDAYREILEENDNEFADKIKIIYKIEIKLEEKSITKNVNVNKDTFNIYISGIDTYGNISSVSRSDVNIIATVNPKTHQILLTTIPRDYYVQLHGTTGYKDKLTHAGIYGMDKSIKTIEDLLNIEINYYIKVNFSSVEKIIDSLNGVDVYSKYTFIGANKTSFKQGYNRVNGKQALEFVRTRKTIVGGDRTRGENQQALIEAIINKACSKEIITKYTSLLSSLENSFQTNMGTDKITEIIKKQINEMAPWNITSISLDGQNGREYTYSYPHQTLYVMIPNETTIENAKTKIQSVINDEVLEKSYEKTDATVNIPTKIETEKPKSPDPVPEQEQIKNEEQNETNETTMPDSTNDENKEETKKENPPEDKQSESEEKNNTQSTEKPNDEANENKEITTEKPSTNTEKPKEDNETTTEKKEDNKTSTENKETNTSNSEKKEPENKTEKEEKNTN